MKNPGYLNIKGFPAGSKLVLIVLFSLNIISSSLVFGQSDTSSFSQYKGIILDSKSKKELAFATLSVLGTNIAGVSNSEGEFSLKVPKQNANADLLISFLGYKNKLINLKDIKSENNQILLESFNIALGEVVVSTNDAEKLFNQVISRIAQNYSNDQHLL